LCRIQSFPWGVYNLNGFLLVPNLA
jgi:hypothetical protein